MADSMTPDILKIAEAFASKESSTAEDVIALVRGLRQIEDSNQAPLAASAAIPAAATEQLTQDQEQPPAPRPVETAASPEPAPSAPESRKTAAAKPEKAPVETATAVSPPLPPSKPRRKADRPKPAVSYDQAVTPDLVYCLECGKGMKMMKRHLGETHKLTPDEYRERWQLPDDWPITAPNYAQSKSKHAKGMGLGVPGKAAPAHSNRGRKPEPVEVNEEG